MTKSSLVSTHSPTLRWQFPVDDFTQEILKPVCISHLFQFTPEILPLLSLHPSYKPESSSNTCQAVFRIKPCLNINESPTWQISLTISVFKGSTKDVSSNVGSSAIAQIQYLPIAARLWTKCYLTSDTKAQSGLCKILGASIDFDGLIAHNFLTYQALHGLDDLVTHVLQSASKDGDDWATTPAAQGRLLAEIRATMDELRLVLLGNSTTFIPNDLDRGIPAWDARLAHWIEKLGAKTIAKDVRDRGRIAANTGGAAFWEKWLPSPAWPPLRRLAFAAFALWSVRVRPTLEREARSAPLQIGIITYAGDSYAAMPKIAAPVSWAFGAPGIPVKEVDGDHYAHEPSFIEDTALLPRSWKLLPSDHSRKPHQTALPIDDIHINQGYLKNESSVSQNPMEDHGETLPVAIAGSQGYVLSPYAAKIALLMLASPQVKAGEMVRSTIGELTRLTRPEAKRLQSRDYEAAARGLDELHHLFIFLPDNTKVPVFQVQSPARPELARPDMTLRYGLTALFSEALSQAASGSLHGPGLQGREYSGQFLLNLTGTMRLPNNKPTLLRYYMRFAAHWNAAFTPGSKGEFDLGRMPSHTIEEWAAIANALPPGVVEYIEAKRGGIVSKKRAPQLSMERKRAIEDLDTLADEHGLIKLEKRGDVILPLPPSSYIEAWCLFRGQMKLDLVYLFTNNFTQPHIPSGVYLDVFRPHSDAFCPHCCTDPPNFCTDPPNSRGLKSLKSFRISFLKYISPLFFGRGYTPTKK